MFVNVRRLFAFIEHSLDEGLQWAVFEPNEPRLPGAAPPVSGVTRPFSARRPSLQSLP
jgi:hypothetical protein